ncbi:3-carboxy-cis,cis-muconate cycloisomerase [Nonomuraea sp. NPDC050556]|uniref:3-carboxy-cis,cis-muconate cycloisomerase n=1 Tax=Nonomuraea sp. NPDC050556 TaxID=3364369 RepID=UPI00378A85EC
MSSPDLLSPAEAFAGDEAYVRAMLDAEVALARAQASLGLIPHEGAIVEAAERIGADLPAYARDLALRARSGGNPVIPLVEDLRRAAPHAHHGATSQDIMDTATMLVVSRVLPSVLSDLSRTASALKQLAETHRDTPMAARTLTQQAVPTTFGLKAAGWRALVLDAHARLSALTLPAQLGGPAGTLDPAVTAAFAAQLGLAEPALPWHVLRTPIADLAGALAFTTGALGKLAADVLVLSRTEIGEVSEGVGGGSSSMPHKSNPVRATLIAAAARQTPALASILYGSLVAEDERPSGAWHAEWEPLRQCLRLAGGAARDAAELAEGLRVHPDRMRANLRITGDTGSAGELTDRALRRTEGT